MDQAQMLCEKQRERSDLPRKILFVCTGNTCRSPMAAALLNDMARPKEICSAQGELCVEPRYVASSAGLYANEGEPITQAAADALQTEGIASRPDNEYLSHRARSVSEELVEQADEIVGLTASHAMQLLLRFPQAASKISTLPVDVPDPFGGTPEVYRACLALIRHGILRSFFAGEQQQ